jgi:hypothetical protein
MTFERRSGAGESDREESAMRDDQLREWYRSRPNRGPGSPHPTPEALARLARLEGSESDRLATLDHVGQCRMCRSDLELLRAIEAADPPARFKIPGWLPIAAAVMLAIGGTWLWRREAGSDPLRGGSPSALTLIEPADSVASPGAALRFVWHPVAGATRYRFELADEGGRLVYSSDQPDTVVVMPDSVRVAPGRYRWLLEGRSATGEPAAGSGSLRIR